ncbi:hypothetical protein PF005_g16692 [Phytophthora fragariae]|uniref:Uncharacterized protein n=1 Tax=Phytophthora fragariae TaxID=53985 RepID=A0A6A3TE30_9STRA|nr:hypothetical protein PF003_g6983 [Phytophthora fragariae]KAE8931965.1 hypothetical protein PF009_g17988 [Phytophthora fragariae]KAE8998213.1 hypothetical protein PF011_g15146 [Phytophthora fragariae]KAE9097509.1 hypothetical protein PF010_g15934 [Phytophthora fragariae]KAE9099789.1 hypothetical protein PF007_g15746 [Phytophthora fragariae]
MLLVSLVRLQLLGVLWLTRLSLQLMEPTCLSRLLDCMFLSFIWRTLRLSSLSP